MHSLALGHFGCIPHALLGYMDLSVTVPTFALVHTLLMVMDSNTRGLVAACLTYSNDTLEIESFQCIFSGHFSLATDCIPYGTHYKAAVEITRH